MEDLKKKIKAAGKTQSWVALKIGVPYISLSAYLNGYRKPKKDIKKMIDKVL